jgi:hypothetical protein
VVGVAGGGACVVVEITGVTVGPARWSRRSTVRMRRVPVRRARWPTPEVAVRWAANRHGPGRPCHRASSRSCRSPFDGRVGVSDDRKDAVSFLAKPWRRRGVTSVWAKRSEHRDPLRAARPVTSVGASQHRGDGAPRARLRTAHRGAPERGRGGATRAAGQQRSNALLQKICALAPIRFRTSATTHRLWSLADAESIVCAVT